METNPVVNLIVFGSGTSNQHIPTSIKSDGDGSMFQYYSGPVLY